MSHKAKRLRELIHAPAILISPGVYDGFSARLVQKLGFETASISGSAVSESHLGLPDRGIMGFAENADACRHIAASCDLLLQADADTGYGNALNVWFTVRGFETAGVCAVMIEDQVSPKRCGHMAGKAVISQQEMVQKIRAAVDARQDPDFLIKARTDAAGPHGVEEAIRRLNAYAEAGADCLFADALLSGADIEKVRATFPSRCRSTWAGPPRPTTPLLTPRQLESMGVAQVTYPRLLSTAAIRGMEKAMEVFQRDLIDGNTVVDRPDLQVSFDELNELMGLPALEALEARFAS